MLKVIGHVKNRPTLILGLSGENSARLHANEPIFIDLNELADATDSPHPEAILIFGGRDEKSLLDQLRAAAGHAKHEMNCKACGEVFGTDDMDSAAAWSANHPKTCVGKVANA